MNATIRRAATADLNCTPRPLDTCAVCSQGAGLFKHEHLGRICQPCATAAQNIVAAVDAALARKRADVLGQLRQMVLDRRGGAEIPTFYEVEIA